MINPVEMLYCTFGPWDLRSCVRRAGRPPESAGVPAGMDILGLELVGVTKGFGWELELRNFVGGLALDDGRRVELMIFLLTILDARHANASSRGQTVFETGRILSDLNKAVMISRLNLRCFT